MQLALEAEGFAYRKWGDDQICKPGDWLVNNQGDIYTADQETFDRTYRPVSPGVYTKVTPIWAEIAAADGTIATQEGITHDRAGDYLVFNEPDDGDGYAFEFEGFGTIYEPVS